MLSIMPIPHPATIMDAMMADAFRAPPCHLAFPLRSTTSSLPCARPQIEECDDNFVVSMAAPGVKASEINIHYDASEELLTIACKTDVKGSLSFCDWRIRLPGADPEKFKAFHVDGLLTVTVEKAKEVEPEKRQVLVSDTEVMPVDETDVQTYTLHINAAGVARADVGILVEKGSLKVHGETARTGARITERIIRLPRDADANLITASHVDGLLTVSIPKKAQPEPKEIVVEGAPPSSTAANLADTHDEEDAADAVMV